MALLFSFMEGGSISLSSFILSSALYVPNVASNLFSISKVTKELNCSVTFFTTQLWERGLTVLKRDKGCITCILQCTKVLKVISLKRSRM